MNPTIPTIPTEVAAVLADMRRKVQSIHGTARLGYQTGPYAYAGEDMGQYLRDAVDDCEEIVRSIGKLESALTKAEAVEPVACIDERHLHLLRQNWSQGNTLKHPKDAGEGDVLLYTRAQPAAEPEDWRERERLALLWLRELLDGCEVEEGTEPLLLPATYLETIVLTCRFQPGCSGKAATAKRIREILAAPIRKPPTASPAVPVESLGRDADQVFPFPKQPAGQDPTPWFKTIQVELPGWSDRGLNLDHPALLIKLENVDANWAMQEVVAAIRDRFAPPPASVPDGWRDDVSLAAQMLTWGREEGLDGKQTDEIDAHAKKLFAMLAAPPTNQEGAAP